MDWMTLSIELVGLLILCIWIVIPIGEFRQILAKLHPRADRPERENDR
jgi:hypothetical protein